MGLFDFFGDIISTPFDMLGLSRHSRDQQIEQQNQQYLMALQDQYYDENFAAENEEWQRRYDETQSPDAKAREYRKIGINPSAMLQNGNGGFPQTSVQPSSPPNVTPPSQGQIYQGGYNTDLLGDIAKMELNEAQKDEIYSLLKGKLREQEDAHELAQIMRAQKEFTLGLDKVYGSDERANKLANLVQEGLVLYLQGQESEKNAKFLEAKTILSNDEHVLNKQQLPLLKLYLEALIQATKAKAVESSARASEALSSSKVNVANAYVLENEGRIRAVAADVAEYGKADRLKTEVDELWAKRAISQEQYKEACLKIARLDKLLDAYHSNENKVKVDAAIENVLDILGLKFGSALQK